MRKLRLLVVATGVLLWAAPVAPAHAEPIVCHDYPGGCCGDVTVLGKTILTINC